MPEREIDGAWWIIGVTDRGIAGAWWSIGVTDRDRWCRVDHRCHRERDRC